MVDMEKLYSEIPDISGKVVIVTGGNAGVGKFSCKVLLSKGGKVYLAARSKEKAEEAIEEIKKETGKTDIHWLPLDLADLSSVKEAAEQFKSKEKDLHILMNNAGIMATPYAVSKDGFEMQWATNVVGHFAFTRLLLPTLLDTASRSPAGTVRVINLTSEAHMFAPSGGIIFNDIGLETYYVPEFRRYGQSKLGNMLLTKEITKRYADKGIISLSIHPGVIMTQLHSNMHPTWFVRIIGKFANLQAIPEDQGAYTQIYAATHPEVVEKKLGGKFLKPLARVCNPATRDGDNAELATKMWNYLEKEVSAKIDLGKEL